MTNAPSAAPTTHGARHNSWLRFCSQFSLRTLLAVTTLAAAACWWFLRPEVRHEELAGTNLKLLRDVRLARVDPSAPGHDPFSEPTWENVGSWQVLGKRGEGLVSGRYREGQPHGKWTLWHANGRRAAEGTMWHGARNGTWRTWDEHGQLRSQAEYRAGQSRALGAGLAPGMGGIWLPHFVAERHGRARAWHASGELACEGSYRQDRRDGEWTWYDEQGRAIEQGTYVADVREKSWTSGRSTVEYIAGQTREIHNEQLAELAADLASTSVRRQLAAATQLERLGQAGVPLLARAAARDGGSARLLALRALVRQDAVPQGLVPAIEPLTEDADPRLALWAMLAVYQHRPERRAALVGPIAAAARQSPSRQSLAQAAGIVYRCDAARRGLVVRTIVEAFAPRRRMDDGYLDQEQPDEFLVAAVCRLGDDVLVHAASAFDSPRAEVRHFAIATIDALIRRGAGRRVPVAGNRIEVRWEIPSHIEQLVTRAKADPDPAVRQAAEWVGRQPEYGSACGGFSGVVGFTGSGPFF